MLKLHAFLRRCTFLVFFLLTTALTVSAQYRAGIQGTVTDPSGAIVAGATLTLTDKDTNISKTATTDSSGVYTFNGLAPGDYSLTIEKTGFAKKVYADVQVAAEQMSAFNVQLQIGQETQSVTVNGSVAPLIDTETADISSTLSSQQIQALPSFGRDPYRLLSLGTGVFGDNELNNGGGSQNLPGTAGPGGTSAVSSIFQTENQVQITANGERNDTNGFEIDGAQVSDLDWGGAAIITPNEESIKEIRVVSNSYDASLGRNSGAMMEIVSQSGTNNYHGSFFFKADRPGLNAYQAYNGPSGPTADERVPNRFNQFGGSVGGPIIHNKLFAFFSYETLRNDSVNTGTSWVETPQFTSAVQAQTGFISSALLSFPGEGPSFNKVLPTSCAQADMPATNCVAVGTGLNVGSLLTSGRGNMDPTFGQPATPFGVGNGLGDVPDVEFVQYTNPDDSVETQYNGRLDYQMTSSDLFSYSIYWVPNDSTFYNGNARAANLWHSDRLNYSHALMWNHAFGATLINEARFNVERWYYNELESNPQESWGLPLDFVNGMGNVSGITYGSQGPGILYKTAYNARDTVTKVLDNHSLKFGFDMYKEQNEQTTSSGARPDYVFNNLWDFANDAPFQEFGDFNPTTGVPTSITGYLRSSIYALFVQDDYKVKPNLTVNLGLRWEYFTPIDEKYGNISNPILGAAPNELTDLSLQLGGDLYSASAHNFGPQIGFAWTPRTLAGRPFVVRGGFGIGYNRMEEAVTTQPITNVPFDAFFNFEGASAADILYATPSSPDQFSNWPTNPHAVLTFNSTTHVPTTGAPVSLYGIQPNLPTPYTMRYSIETQYDAGHNWVATIGYQGNQSRHYTREQNLDWEFTPVNPQINNIYEYTNDADGNYNALITELEHHFAQGFQIDAQYTYSRAMDDSSDDYFIEDYEFDPRDNWGPSDYDVTNNFKLWGLWSPKFFSGGHDWMEKVIGGWTVSGIWNVHSGFPWTPEYGVQVVGDPDTCSLIYNGSGYCTIRPAAYLGGAGTDHSNSAIESGPMPSDPTALNVNFSKGAAAYFTPPTLTASGIPPAPGVERNSFRGPRYSDVDAQLAKAFGLPTMSVFGENASLEFRANFYNLFNQVNLVPLPDQTIGTLSFDPTTGAETVTQNPTFGQAQNALAGRVIELQARFSF
jgi:hypothetical protein